MFWQTTATNIEQSWRNVFEHSSPNRFKSGVGLSGRFSLTHGSVQVDPQITVAGEHPIKEEVLGDANSCPPKKPSSQQPKAQGALPITKKISKNIPNILSSQLCQSSLRHRASLNLPVSISLSVDLGFLFLLVVSLRLGHGLTDNQLKREKKRKPIRAICVSLRTSWKIICWQITIPVYYIFFLDVIGYFWSLSNPLWSSLCEPRGCCNPAWHEGGYCQQCHPKAVHLRCESACFGMSKA